MRALGPPWTRGEGEKPAGERDMGTWTASVYTAEQQARLGVDEHGQPAGSAPGAGDGVPPQPQGRVGLIGPAWTRGEGEKPAGERDMGTWTAAVYTAEQQARLGVDEHGQLRGAPAAAEA
ncbi:hypothetical protein KFE25_012020 [Diacronema lutheri]|uniref:Uncharacterized protein n=1 Tax=Diacronema lutheri TaxID=2081491 RepID=A0A8J5X9V0_DIALT|nr:hypothetical protein KFE25_012020 [Diacronema lutheri]